jgi:cytochrome P450
VVSKELAIQDMIRTAGFNANPYPVYQRILDQRTWVTPAGATVYARYDDCSAILRNHETFGQGLHNLDDPTFIQLDPPEHTRLRRIVSKAFGPSAISRLVPRINEIAASLMESVAADGTMDLVTTLAHPLPAAVITEMLGAPPEDEPIWSSWQNTIINSTAAPRFLPEQLVEAAIRDASAAEAAREQVAYFDRLITSRRAGPLGQDVLSGLMRAEDDGNRLTKTELLSTVLLLLTAGYHTTVNLIANGALALTRHPGQLELLRNDRSLLPNAVNEMLRYDAPVQTATQRIVRHDTELAGVELRAGQMVVAVIAAANRDPRMFEDPDRFDVGRTGASRHLGFGFGVHHCLGAPLARIEGAAAFDRLLDLPRLRITEGATLDYGHRYGFHGPAALHLSWG